MRSKPVLIKFSSVASGLNYLLFWGKLADVINIEKPGKRPHVVISYRLILLLPLTSKLFEKIQLKRLKAIVENRKLIPDNHFGFINNLSTFHQIHRVTDTIEQALKEKKVWSAIFAKMAYKAWHEDCTIS